jgi:hypothetical protein
MAVAAGLKAENAGAWVKKGPFNLGVPISPTVKHPRVHTFFGQNRSQSVV